MFFETLARQFWRGNIFTSADAFSVNTTGLADYDELGEEGWAGAKNEGQ